MRRVRAALAAVLRWVAEGLAADHTWCWGYTCIVPPPQAWRGAPDRSADDAAQNSSRSSRSTPRSAS